MSQQMSPIIISIEFSPQQNQDISTIILCVQMLQIFPITGIEKHVIIYIVQMASVLGDNTPMRDTWGKDVNNSITTSTHCEISQVVFQGDESYIQPVQIIINFF
jgi:hypothetical protein